MAHASDHRLLVLHGLRLKGFAAADAVAGLWGLDGGEVASTLEQAAADGLAQRRDGRLSGWSLTAGGRARVAALLRSELEQAEADAATVVEDAYARFLDLNGSLLSICTRWQMRDDGGEQVVNDHSDAAHDDAVIAELVGLHDSVRPVCADLRDALDRFAGYGTRLRNAVEKVVDGDHDWFTKPMIDSYHTVWFEMHEDLLATLGRERASEETV